MKEISEIIKKISAEALKELAAHLNLKTKSKKELLGTLLTPTGIDSVLRNFDTTSLRVLKAVYDSPDGITFAQIIKELKIEIHTVEKISDTLTRNLLIYVTKNRQMLNTKQDKAYGITEFGELLNLSDVQMLTDRLYKNFLHLEIQKQNQDYNKILKDREIKDFLKFMAESGCIVSLDTAKEKLPSRSIDKILTSLIQQNVLSLHHLYQPEFNSYLLLNEKISPSVAAFHDREDTRKHLNVRNRYFLLNNLLHAYDIISTFGLFLTKQMEFRKIDIRRISDSMLPLKDIRGKDLPPEELAQLSMFFLNRMKCLKLNKVIAGISLADLQKDIEQPLALLKRVLKCVDDPPAYDSFFRPPFEMPQNEFSRKRPPLPFSGTAHSNSGASTTSARPITIVLSANVAWSTTRRSTGWSASFLATACASTRSVTRASDPVS
jgi:hypothetical protein